MCPLWPLHILILYVLCVLPLLLMAQHVPTGKAQHQPKQLQVFFGAELSDKIMEGESKMVEFQIADMDNYKDSGSFEVELTNSNPEIASVDAGQVGNKFMLMDSQDFVPNSNWTGSFNLTARFLGYTKVAVKLWGRIKPGVGKKELLAESEPGKVAVIRAPRAIDKAFIYTVAILVSVAFINMGCLLDLEIVKATLKKPIGPIIGFCCQYLFMPVVIILLLRIPTPTESFNHECNFCNYRLLSDWPSSFCRTILPCSWACLSLDAALEAADLICGPTFSEAISI